MISDLKKMWQDSPFYSVKFDTYFQIYEDLFKHLQNKQITFVEIGIQGGGSLFAWKEYFGDSSRIIGIDLNPECLKLSEFGFEIFIGDAADSNFLSETFHKIGHIDVILDDGGHLYHQQINVLEQSALLQSKELLVVIEDTSTSFYNDFNNKSYKRTFLGYCKDLTDLLQHRFYLAQMNRFKKFKPDYNLVAKYKNLASINFFPGIVSFKFTTIVADLPKLISNERSNLFSKTDFRYNGIGKIKISWPYYNRRKIHTVGISKLKNFIFKFSLFLKKLLVYK